MSTLFKRIVVLSVLASVSCYYVNAVGVSARPAPVVRSAPTVRSTPIKSTPVKSTPSKSNSVKSTKSTTETKSSSETRNITNNYYNNGGFFNSVMGAFTGTWLYHSLFDDNNTKETNTEDTNSGSNEEDETFSISSWITNNLEYVKNLLFGTK
jgi:lipoprotein